MTPRGYRRMKLGDYPDISLKEAREMAQEARGSVAKGRDPQAERKAEREKAGREKEATFEQLAVDYLAYAKVNKKSWQEDERQLNRDVLPRLRGVPVAQITRHEVARVVGAIADRGPLVQANRTRTLLGMMFNFALTDDRWEGIVDANPALATSKPLKKESPRERVLTEEELPRLWSALEDLHPVLSASYKLRILTGQRSVEVRTMRWSDIEGDWWTIPREVTKNKHAHRVPLSQQALEVIEELRPLTGEGEWVLESPVKPGQPVGAANQAHARLKKGAGLEDFRGHDLRRTVGTQLAKLSVSIDVIGKILNHADAGITARVYVRHTYDDEKRRALGRWADRLDEILGGERETGRVVSFPA
jgi:integrase